MASLHPGITGRTDNHLEPLAVTPRQACVLLGVGNTRLYQLICNGELESYLDGRARRITMRSIHGRIARLLASASATGTATEDTPLPRHSGRKAEHDRGSGRDGPRPRPQEDEPGIA